MNTPDRFHILPPDATDVSADDYQPAPARARLTARPAPTGLHDLRESARFYRPSAELVTAINTALAVEAPLLITGEPGTGKTQVAYYLERFFGIPLFPYQVRSTSTVDDMKYDFDAVGYLHYAQHGDPKDQPRTREDYLTPNALWQAFECAGPCVLLIDEIDKAPRDFPNDLLQELDQYCFQHPFDTRQIPATPMPQRPIVVVTSNVERRLPDAFLRRCVFHHIALTEALIDQAVAARFGNDHSRKPFPALDAAVITQAKVSFWEIYHNDLIHKKPSTAELLVWLMVLSVQGHTADTLRAISLPDLPGLNTLIKDKDDLERLQDGYG